MSALRCPHCDSYGIVLRRRSLVRRLLKKKNKRYCIDCNREFPVHQAIKEDESAAAMAAPPSENSRAGG